MPAVPQQIDWPGIRAAAVTLGIRGAARSAARDLPPDEAERFTERVMKRASRERWKSAASAAMSATGSTMPTPQQGPTMPLSAKVRNGAETAANAIAESKIASLTALSSVTAKIARKWDNVQDDKDLPEPEKVNQLASAHAKLHPGEKAEVNVSLNIAAFFG